MPRNASDLPKIGNIFAEQYELLELIGQGGMGVVYRARQIRLQREVALKVLRPEVVASGYEQFRLEREAVSAAKFRSHHVVDIYDWGIAADGPAYLVMELLHGETLGQRLEREIVQAPEQVVVWLRQCSEALDEAAALGIVHRDIKPANLFLANTQIAGSAEVKILDFGITKIFDSNRVAFNQEVTTRSSLRLGTPRYMSPEQLRATSGVDARADIWSLGVVAYQALCGRYPFDREYEADLIVSILSDEPRPLHLENPRLSAAVGDAVARALQKNVDARYQSAGEFARALSAALSREPPKRASALSAAPALRRPEPSRSQVRTNASDDSRRVAASRPRRSFSGVLIGGIAFVLSAAAAFAISQRPKKHGLDPDPPVTVTAPRAVAESPTSPVARADSTPYPSAQSATNASASADARSTRKPPTSPPRASVQRAAVPVKKPSAHQFERDNPYAN